MFVQEVRIEGGFLHIISMTTRMITVVNYSKKMKPFGVNCGNIKTWMLRKHMK